MAGVPRELWLAQSQGGNSDNVAVMVVSVPGRTATSHSSPLGGERRRCRRMLEHT